MIYFFTKGSEVVPSSRRRVFYLSTYLQKLGYDSRVYVPTHRPWWDISIGRITEAWSHVLFFVRLKKEDIVYLHRPIYQVDFILICLFFRIFLKRQFIFDFDDPIFLHSRVKTYLLTRYARTVVVAGHFLEAYAKRINRDVRIIPMLVDTQAIALRKKDFEVKNSYTIGWIGDAVIHLENLKILTPVLKALAAEHISFTFVLVGAKKDQRVYDTFTIPGVSVEYIDWVEPSMVGDIMERFDVATTPLIQSDWEEGKCPIKTYEYLQYGIPTVASNVGEAKYFITHGVNGFLANSTQEWVTAIKQLTTNRQLAQTISAAGRATIEKDFSYESYVETYKKLFADMTR